MERHCGTREVLKLSIIISSVPLKEKRTRLRTRLERSEDKFPGLPAGTILHPRIAERDAMTNHTYRVIEIVGTSPDSVDAAIRNGLARAAETTRGLDWFEVQSVRGHLEDGPVAHFQVTLKVGFQLEDA
jgi:dodecin